MTYTVDKRSGEQLPAQIQFVAGKPNIGDIIHPPEKSTAYILSEGSGDQLTNKSSPIVQYIAKNLSTNTFLENTYEKGLGLKS